MILFYPINLITIWRNLESRALQSKQDEVVRAAQEADASKVRVFQQFFTLKYADFLSLLLLILHHHNLNFTLESYKLISWWATG